MDEKSSDLDAYIKDLSECPVCIEAIKSAPIHQCANGHVICKNCISKLDSCPICRSDSTLARNLMFEQIIAKIYGPQKVKEGPYENSKLEEWGHGSARVHFSNEGPTIQYDQYLMYHVGKCIRSVFKFMGKFGPFGCFTIFFLFFAFKKRFPDVPATISRGPGKETFLTVFSLKSIYHFRNAVFSLRSIYHFSNGFDSFFTT